MDEDEWLAREDPAEMLDSLGADPSERKLRLFACACCRRLWGRLDGPSRRALAAGERFADEPDGAEQMEETDAWASVWEALGVAAVWPATPSKWASAWRAIHLPPAATVRGEARAMGGLVLDVVGNP